MEKMLRQECRCDPLINMKKATLILVTSTTFLLLFAGPSLALDMEYYTYGGFNPITQAFTKIALIFSDSAYQGLLFVIMVLGLIAGVAAWLARAATRPDGGVVGDASEPECVTPATNACKKVTLRKSVKIRWRDVFNASFVNVSIRDVSFLYLPP